MLGNCIRVIEILIRLDTFVSILQGVRIVKRTGPKNSSVELVKTSSQGLEFRIVQLPARQMPFARHNRSIAIFSKSLGDRDTLAFEYLQFGYLVIIETRQKRCASRPTFCRVVELSKSQSILRKRIDIRCRDFRSITANITIAHIIDDDKNDVRPILSKR